MAGKGAVRPGNRCGELFPWPTPCLGSWTDRRQSFEPKENDHGQAVSEAALPEVSSQKVKI